MGTAGTKNQTREKEFYKAPTNSKQIESVVFIPHTPGSILWNMMNKVEASLKFRCRYKYVEEMGFSLRHLLCRKDPNPEHCGRSNCFPCREAPGKCTRPGALYQIRCLGCEELGNKMVYLGEMARTCFDRGLEHLGALKSSNTDSPLVEHCYDQHQGVLQEFKLKVVTFPKTTMLRQN